MEGLFITVEGPDGAGKTSVIEALSPLLAQQVALPLVVTREPGGIPIAEEIRQIILNPKNQLMDERTEALLYAAARRQHLVEKVLPAIESGALVLCDRFVDSSLAYQGAGRKIGMEAIASINVFATEGRMPDFTLYLDVDIDTGLERIQKGRNLEEMDRLDNELPEFHQRVRHGYLKIVAENSVRMQKIDARQSLETVVKQCYNALYERFPEIFVEKEGAK